MKTKFTLLWLALMVTLAPLGNSVYASGSHPAADYESSLIPLTKSSPPSPSPNLVPAKADTNAPVNQVSVVSESLRIGTYNFQFWPDGYEDVLPIGNLCCDNIDDRERKVAERVIASGYD